MVITIPSKNIYNKNNPKILDNIIERIEVGAVEVVPNNEYETPVYNESLDLNTFIEQENNEKQRYIVDTGTGGESMYYNYAYVYLDNKIKYLSKTITLNKLKNNSFISKIYHEKDQNNKEQIQYSLRLEKTKKPVFAKIKLDGYNANIIEKAYGDVLERVEITQTSNDRKFPQMPITVEKKVFGATAKLFGINDPTNLHIGYIENEDNYEIEISILEYLYYEKFSGGYEVGGPLSRPTVELNVEGEVEEYNPLELEITIYGNTIGIDLTDKTVYINGETAKKVQSFEGNELMQTSNYRKGEIKIKIIDIAVGKAYFEVLEGNVVENDILYKKGTQKRMTVKKDERGFYLSGNISGYFHVDQEVICERHSGHLLGAFTLTAENYAKGKETATIRCSISDYFDFTTKSKVISVDSNRMAFDLYDEVIPMVYKFNEDKGKWEDTAMSLTKDGFPKVFQVLGQKIYYDGAVWQELSLQESETKLTEEDMPTPEPEEPETPEPPTPEEPEVEKVTYTFNDLSGLKDGGEITDNDNIITITATDIAIRNYNVLVTSGDTITITVNYNDIDYRYSIIGVTFIYTTTINSSVFEEPDNFDLTISDYEGLDNNKHEYSIKEDEDDVSKITFTANRSATISNIIVTVVKESVGIN